MKKGQPLPMQFKFQCGLIVGFTDTGIEVCPMDKGHDGECVRSEGNPRRIHRLCRNFVQHPCKREYAS